MKYELVIFDLDGTLVDTVADLGTAVNAALSVKGLPVHPLESYRNRVGHGVRDLVRRSMPEPSQDDGLLLDEMLGFFLEYYTAHIDVHSRPYPGIPELLADLIAAGRKLAVASNKFQAGTEKLIRRTFPEIPFAAVRGGQDGRPLKPDPAVVLDILAAVGVSPDAAVLVGDSGTDIATAAAAGLPSVSVTWGFRPREALQGATRIADTVADLRRILLENNLS